MFVFGGGRPPPRFIEVFYHKLMTVLVVFDGSSSFYALILEILQAQITFHRSATRTTYLSYMYDVTPENKNMYV